MPLYVSITKHYTIVYFYTISKSAALSSAQTTSAWNGLLQKTATSFQNPITVALYSPKNVELGEFLHGLVFFRKCLRQVILCKGSR